MRKTFLKLFVKAMLPFMTAGAALAASETPPAPKDAAPADPGATPVQEPYAAEAPQGADGGAAAPETVPYGDFRIYNEGEGHTEGTYGAFTDGISHGATDAASYADAAEHAAPGLPQMDPTWFPSQVFWLAVTFICLYVFFSRKILPDLSSTIDNRRSQIQGDLDMAQRLKEEAEAVQSAYEAELNEARRKCADMFQDVEDRISKKTAKKMDGFALRAETDVQDAEAAIAEARKAALGEMNTVAAEIASLAAQKIIGVEPDLDQAKTVVKKLGLKAA